MVGTGAAVAADAEAPPPALHGSFEAEFGTRTWLGFSRTQYDLYGVSASEGMVSRLVYGDVPTATGELFAKLKFDNKFFISGFAGVGLASGGTLIDEDFPPGINPYSSTTSDQSDGTIGYAVIDFGRTVMETPKGKLGLFLGYSYLDQTFNSFGCVQTATNPEICVPSFDSSSEMIDQHSTWQSIRVGLNGETSLGNNLTLSGEAAFLPAVTLDASDKHLQRIPDDFSGATPQDGNGWGAQLQAMIDYQVNDKLTIGLGGRYWHMETEGTMHFEDSADDGSPQDLNFSTDVVGLLAEVKSSF